MTGYIGLDFETYAFTSLPDHGLYRYVNCPTFRPLIGAVSRRLPDGSHWTERADFVKQGHTNARQFIKAQIGDAFIVAHNAPFERAVLDKMGLYYPASRFIDSAVTARAAGAGGKLEAAAPQLLGVDKVDAGKHLMRVFSIPTKQMIEDGITTFDEDLVVQRAAEWDEYGDYCGVDSLLGLRIQEEWGWVLTPQEFKFQTITLEMNETGWHVDLDLVEEMQRRYLENMEFALADFRQDHTAADLNLNSLPQMKKWTAERGVKCVSFDEKHVARYILAINKKLAAHWAGDKILKQEQVYNYEAVRALLETKQILGGSSLKKLATILNTAYEGRLQDQYLHCGAGQTWRTTGRSTQMQNLKRLDAENIANVEELFNPDVEWDNDQMATNIRQGFTATDENGFLIVGDFKSVESRGLAWAAGEDWKTTAYRHGQDLYVVNARKMLNIDPAVEVTKDQRMRGKVGELSCGYGAGGQAVVDFAAGMGTTLTLDEANTLVADWRAACPKTLEFWAWLDAALHAVVEDHDGANTRRSWALPDGLFLRLYPGVTPDTLTQQHPGAKSVIMDVITKGSDIIMRRVFHGCYLRGRDVCYYKPSDLKSGDLWKQSYIHPKTKQLTFHKIYGGKLAGIFTQSFCRELFMEALEKTARWAKDHANVELVGQFHDEIVLDWSSQYTATIGLEDAKRMLGHHMSSPGWAPSFPLAADIKHDYRYTK